MKIDMNRALTTASFGLVLTRAALVVFDFYPLGGFSIGITIWNIFPIGLLAWASVSLQERSRHTYPLLATVILVGSMTVLCLIEAPGDGLIWLFLPAWELILGGVTFVIGTLIEKCIFRIRNRRIRFDAESKHDP